MEYWVTAQAVRLQWVLEELCKAQEQYPHKKAV